MKKPRRTIKPSVASLAPRRFTVRHGGYPGFQVLVTIGMTQAEVRKLVEAEYIATQSDLDAICATGEEANGSLRGRTVMLDGGRTVLSLSEWDGSPKHRGYLAHEAFHAVCFLMLRVGVRFCRKSEEAFAYALHGLIEAIETKIAEGTDGRAPCSER